MNLPVLAGVPVLVDKRTESEHEAGFTRRDTHGFPVSA